MVRAYTKMSFSIGAGWRVEQESQKARDLMQTTPQTASLGQIGGTTESAS